MFFGVDSNYYFRQIFEIFHLKNHVICYLLGTLYVYKSGEGQNVVGVEHGHLSGGALSQGKHVARGCKLQGVQHSARKKCVRIVERLDFCTYSISRVRDVWPVIGTPC
jgi:hypothetical protein